MKRILTTLLILSALCCAASAQSMEKHKYYGLGSTREYYLYNPENITAGAPLVIMLHGYGGKAENYRPEMLELAKKYGFALCVPQGAKDPTGKTGWNVRYPNQAGMKANDETFILNLAKKLQKEYGYSKANTFLCGMSNGGDIGYVFAWKHPEAFGAIASVAGLTFEWLIEESFPKGPVPFMEVHGTEDRTSEWNGDHDNAGGWGAYTSVPIAISYMIAANRCRTEETIELPCLDPGKPSRDVILHRFFDGVGGCEVRLYEVVGGPHSWHLADIDTCEEIWNFFSQYIVDDTGAYINQSVVPQAKKAEEGERGVVEESTPRIKKAVQPEVIAVEPAPAPETRTAPAVEAGDINDRLLEEARRHMGKPYRYAGTGPASFDCSGFTYYVFKQCGINLPHSSLEQSKTGTAVSVQNLRRGDLVFFNGRGIGNTIGHVGIVEDVHEDGTFTFIHAAVQGGVIVSDSLEPYYSARYKAARRIL